MSFLRPELLWFAPLFPALFVAVLALSRKCSVRTGGFGALPLKAKWNRHGTYAAMLAALIAIGLSIAGPQATWGTASQSGTVILALDVSGSMNAKDIAPSRLMASQLAAQAFVDAAPRDMLIGVVVFCDAASLLVVPTVDRRVLKAAIQGSRANGGTAIGDGMMLALAQIFPDGSVNLTGDPVRSERRTPSLIKSAWVAPISQPGAKSSAILLLTDGQNTDGLDPQEAAEAAAAHGVRVFAIGFGTQKGVVAGTGSSSVRVPMNARMLRAIAETTRGEYFHASGGAQLQEIYIDVERRLIDTTRPVEITALFSLVAAIALGVAGLTCVLWQGRIV